MLVEFPCGDELIQRLPDGGIVNLVGLYDAVDGSKDVTFHAAYEKYTGLN